MIRKMKETDLPLVMELMQQEDEFWHSMWDINTINKAYKSSDRLSFVYLDNDNIVGSIFASDLGFRAYLSGLIVNKNYRNKRIAKQLVLRVENELKQTNSELIIADVLPHAVSFFEKLGWKSPYAKLMRKKIYE